MAGPGSELKGLKEVREALQEFTKTVQRNVGKRALVIPADIIGAAVQARAPVSSRPSDPTKGSLRGAMQVVKAKGGRGTMATVAVLVADPAAVPNEYGTTKMAAQPFFRPGVDASESAAVSAFERALTDEVFKQAANAAAKSKAVAG